jgi:hypothetical protein
MTGVVFEVRKRTRGNVTTPMVLWALVMAVVIFLLESRLADQSATVWAGVVATALLGIYLGWRRRSPAVFVAPIVSWLFAWPLLWVAAMIHDGFVKGLFVGLFLITIGWIGIGVTEFVWLGLVTLLVRSLRGSGPRGPDVVIIGPRGE